MNRPVELPVRIAPPDKAAEILNKCGYSGVNPKLLRRWYKQGVIPGVHTGRKVLLPLEKIVAVLEGDVAIQDNHQSGAIRQIEG